MSKHEPTNEEIMNALNEFKTEWSDHKKAQDETHGKMREEMSALKTQIAPIADVYNSLMGAGNVGRAIMKWVVIPASIVIGIVYTIIRINHDN